MSHLTAPPAARSNSNSSSSRSLSRSWQRILGKSLTLVSVSFPLYVCVRMLDCLGMYVCMLAVCNCGCDCLHIATAAAAGVALFIMCHVIHLHCLTVHRFLLFFFTCFFFFFLYSKNDLHKIYCCHITKQLVNVAVACSCCCCCLIVRKAQLLRHITYTPRGEP